MMASLKHGLPWFGAWLAAVCAGGGRGDGLFVSPVNCRTTTQLNI